MTKLSAKLYTWVGQTVFLGRLPNIEEHSHHALQIEVGLQKQFRIYSGKDCLDCQFAIIPPNVPHRIDDCKNLQAIIYLEPDHVVSNILKKKYFPNGSLKKLNFEIIKPFINMLQKLAKEIYPCNEVKDLLDNILNLLAEDYSPTEFLDRRIKTVIDVCKQASEKIITVSVLAKKVNLSENRLTHLFKEQVGIPIRRYLLWLRLSDALMELSRGGSFTHAAHYAGFSDAAHLSRTYRKMYGNSLYDLARNSQFIQAIPCFE
jgi:AraC-like DNA-binding protein